MAIWHVETFRDDEGHVVYRESTQAEEAFRAQVLLHRPTAGGVQTMQVMVPVAAVLLSEEPGADHLSEIFERWPEWEKMAVELLNKPKIVLPGGPPRRPSMQ